MKLYTEEQVRLLLNEILILSSSVDDAIDSLTPIELPSDDEIKKMVGFGGDNDSAINGAEWMKEQILIQNNQLENIPSTAIAVNHQFELYEKYGNKCKICGREKWQHKDITIN